MGKRLGALGTVVAMIEGSNHLFDYVVSPALILWLGPMKGGALFFVAAFLLNYLIIVWYKRTNSDWFGLEWLRLQENVDSDSTTGKIIRGFLRSARPIAYVGLCVYDPTYGFIYFRGRQTGSQFSRADWFWFVVSNLIGILIWIVLVAGVTEGAKAIF